MGISGKEAMGSKYHGNYSRVCKTAKVLLSSENDDFKTEFADHTKEDPAGHNHHIAEEINGLSGRRTEKTWNIN